MELDIGGMENLWTRLGQKNSRVTVNGIIEV
jgi:hypothetical protein